MDYFILNAYTILKIKCLHYRLFLFYQWYKMLFKPGYYILLLRLQNVQGVYADRISIHVHRITPQTSEHITIGQKPYSIDFK